MVGMKKSEALKILGLADGAGDDEIKKAHRKLVIAHHPDKFPLNSAKRAEAEELTKQINEARDVLINRSWSPEFDPRRDARPYAGNPYARPAQRPQGGAPGQGGSAWDPFTDGWPFGQGGWAAGPGQATYVWTSWDGTRSSQGAHVSGSSGGAGAPRPGAAGVGGTGGGVGFNPFDFEFEFDPTNPFSPFRATRSVRVDPDELRREALTALQREAGIVGLKLAALAVCSLLGAAAIGLFVYVIASIVYGLWKRLGGCLATFLIPIAIVLAPFIMLIAPRNGATTAGLAVAFFAAAAFDVVNIRDVVRTYRAVR